ncbi:uncharacterized protein LOC108680903 [Hyalella azteca]|uniref:Uncharacterized protein LOC108680903 n=1 Tax=Hyalella azteca TaxID=294128 RepID=A0A8B7PH41_HYAAZ|nr:uncharacterized protein LOC108680903 [Hyalella azteca]
MPDAVDKVVYCVAFSLSLWWLLDESMYRSEHTNSSGRVPGYVLCAGHLVLVVASFVMLYGLYKRMARVVLCWVLLMVLVFFPEMGLVLFVNLYHRTVATSSGMLDLALYTVRAALNVVCILCVHSLYTSWRRSRKTHQLHQLPHHQLSPPKDALEDESLYNGSYYSGLPPAYPASLYSQPPYSGYNNGYDIDGYDTRSLGGYGSNGYAANGYDGRFDNGYLNNGYAASKELVPSKGNGLRMEPRALSRCSSHLSLRYDPVYGSQRLPAQFNAALYASATSLTNVAGHTGSYYLRGGCLQHQRQLVSAGGLHTAAYLQQMVQYLPQDYATQSLDRRGLRREEDCDTLSLRGVGVRGPRQGFILAPRGRGSLAPRGRGSQMSLGGNSDELGQYKDVAL